MADAATFSRNIRRRAEQVIESTKQVKILAAVRAGATLVRETPVDTGLTRSNWVAALGATDLSPRPVRSVESTVSDIQSIANAAALEQPIHIANGGEKAPHLAGLNDGNSQQAPRGFMREAVVQAQALIRGFRLLKG